MSGLTLAILSFPALLVLLLLRLPLALVLFALGGAGIWAVTGSPAVLTGQMKALAFGTFSSYALSVVPLFLLMGQLAGRSGLSADLFRAGQDWLGHRKGGLAMAAIGACAGFGAICGSSLATAAAMGRVALPELQRHGYSGRLATGTLAAGGTLGILIPPSIVLVIYAIQSEQNIEKLFIAGILPGLIAALGYMIVIALVARFGSGAPAPEARVPMGKRIRDLGRLWHAALIFAIVIGGIYSGLFSPTEAAAIAVAVQLVQMWFAGSLTREVLSASMAETATTSAMIYLIVLGAQVFNTFLALTHLPDAVSGFVTDLGWSPMMVLWAVIVLYLVLGCIMDSLSMIILTTPILFPVLSGLDYGMSPGEFGIWFGILTLVAVEVGLITPPVGMNLFVLNAMAKTVPMRETWAGVLPFIASDLLRIVLLVLVPWISLVFVS